MVLVLPLASSLTAAKETALDGANIVIWLLFVVDYFARLYLVQDRRAFFRIHILDLVVIAVPFLRPFRLLRLMAIVISTSRRAGGRAVRRAGWFRASPRNAVLRAARFRAEHD